MKHMRCSCKQVFWKHFTSLLRNIHAKVWCQLQCGFMKITLNDGYSPVSLMANFFMIPFRENILACSELLCTSRTKIKFFYSYSFSRVTCCQLFIFNENWEFIPLKGLSQNNYIFVFNVQHGKVRKLCLYKWTFEGLQFLRLLCRHHEFLHKASLLAFLTNTLPLKHPQNFYQNQEFTKGSSLQCLSIFFKEWCNVYKIFRGSKKKYGIV